MARQSPVKYDSSLGFFYFMPAVITLNKSSDENLLYFSYRHYLNICAGGQNGAGPHIHRIDVIDNITAHMLRHTYATMLFDAGVDVKSAQRFLGHEDIEVTLSISTHLTKFKEDQAVYALNEHLDEMIETRQFLTTIQ